ncbi:hypothetical protein IFM89_003275, partial [Coptis chinensis]
MELSPAFSWSTEDELSVDNNVFHPLLQVQLARTLTNAKQIFEMVREAISRKRFE